MVNHMKTSLLRLRDHMCATKCRETDVALQSLRATCSLSAENGTGKPATFLNLEGFRNPKCEMEFEPCDIRQFWCQLSLRVFLQWHKTTLTSPCPCYQVKLALGGKFPPNLNKKKLETIILVTFLWVYLSLTCPHNCKLLCGFM